MDAFMDKLAQKLTAQEMIKANAAAEAAEMNRLKSQVAQYEALLNDMREVSRGNKDAVEQVNKLAEECTARIASTDMVDMLIDESISKIKEIQQDGQAVREISGKLLELKGTIENLQAEVTDYVHKENVKVYRNVQAVVVEELGKQAEKVGNALQASGRKVNAVFILSIMSLLVAVAGLVLQILTRV